MNARRMVGWVVAAVCLGRGVCAQDVPGGIAKARQLIEAKAWAAALEVLLDLQPKATDAECEPLAQRFHEVAEGLMEGPALADALRAREAALTLCERVHGNADHQAVQDSLNALAVCLHWMGRASDALPRYERALAMQRRLCGGRDDPDVAMGIHNVAACLDSLGRASEALVLQAEALAMRKRLFGDSDHADVAQSLNGVASCLDSLGRQAEALPHYEEALAMRKRLYGDRDHGDLSDSLNNMAYCLRSLGRESEALPLYEQSLAMTRRLHGDRDHVAVALRLNNVAHCLDSLGRTTEALTHYEAALAMRRRLHGDADHPSVARCLNSTALCLDSLGRTTEALLLHEEALALRKRLFGDADHDDVAESLSNVASCLDSLGRTGEASRQYEAALAMRQRLHGGRDHPDVARSLNNVAYGLQMSGRGQEALTLYERSLAMYRRLYGDADRSSVALGLNNLASCLDSMGRTAEALAPNEAALAMRQRLHGGRDHPDVATSLRSVASCLRSLGRTSEALPLHAQSLAMYRRLHGDADHPVVARGLNSVAICFNSLGRSSEALPLYEQALAMYRRLHADADHEDVALGFNNLASCLDSLGRSGEALPHYEQALAMWRRLRGDNDHADIADGLNNVAFCLSSLGRTNAARTLYEQALAMKKRLYGDRAHPDVATGLSNVASCLSSVGQSTEALQLYEQALAMRKRLYGEGDHPDVASSLNGVAYCLKSLGRATEALEQHQAALAMRRRLYGDRAHPDVAQSLNNVAFLLNAVGRSQEALPLHEESLAMYHQLYGEGDHPDVVMSQNNLAGCLASLGQVSRALTLAKEACTAIERLREQFLASDEMRQSWFDELKRRGAFERAQGLANRLHESGEALSAAERSRGRELLDLFEQQRSDPLGEAEQRARRRGDEGAERRLRRLRTDLVAVEMESDRLLHQLTRLDEDAIAGQRDTKRTTLLAQSDAIAVRLRQLRDERARELADVLPVGRVRTAAEIQSVLRDGELFLEFTVTEDVNLLYVLARDGDIVVCELPRAHATIERVLGKVLQRTSRTEIDPRGRDAEGRPADAGSARAARELFEALIPRVLWPRLQSSRCVFVAAHRELHRLPFELLVTDEKDGEPVRWLDNGPAVAYVPSGSALYWLRQRAREVRDDATSLDVLAVADPSELAREPEVPLEGAIVFAVNDGSEGARVGLLPRDVLLCYDGRPVVDDASLRDARMATEVAIEDGKRADTPIPVEVWRRGERLSVDVRKGLLGVEIGKGRARAAHEASLGAEARMALVTRAGDVERLRQLPPLRGALAETQAIERVCADKGGKGKRLVGTEATEPAVFDLAPKAKYLHFACHGVAEEYAGQSLSMLVLAQPKDVLPGDDGLLKLGDLLNAWRGRLSSCRLVVLSACRTNVGPTLRDEAPQALPVGFLFAGAPAVVSSLWSVDDASTRELMTDFYGRLFAGETNRLAAFTAAKKALRQKHPDPFHWAPFLYIGSPE